MGKSVLNQKDLLQGKWTENLQSNFYPESYDKWASGIICSRDQQFIEDNINKENVTKSVYVYSTVNMVLM